MAFITLSGTLLDPNGDLAVGDQIRFTHKSTTGETVESAVSIITINPAGTYSLPLQYGLVLVEYKDVRKQQFKNLGIATVNATNPATSIPELLNALVPVSSAELIEFQAILADCVTTQTAAENAATTAEAFAYQLTTTDLIASTATFTANTNIPTSGFSASGDEGDGNWKQNGVTGQTPSQSPAQLGDALLNDGNGNQWGFVGKALFLEQIGGVLDGVTLNDGVISAAKSYCTSTGNNIYFGTGTLLSGQILVTTGEELKLSGLDKVLSIHKIADGTNSNNAQVTGDGTGKLSLSNMTLDGNMDNQTGGGHGIRSAGCEKLWLTNILIKNSLNYGIGLQAGTSKDLKWRDVEINRCGSDGVDIKDYNFNNEVIDLVGFKCSGHGETNPQSPALDVRGGIIASNIEVNIIGDNYGLRFRFGDGVQGRDGFGSMSNATITGDGVSVSQALRCDSASDNFTYSDTTIDNCSVAINQNATAIGGALSNITAKQIYGGDGCSVGGTDLILSNFKISNKTGNTRLIDVEPTANNFQLSNFNAKDTIGANGIRIQALASDCSFTNGVIRNANYQDLGTATVQSNVRLL